MTFDKSTMEMIRKEMNDVLSRYGAPKDIQFKIGNITYDDNSFRTTLKVVNVGNGHNPDKAEFEKFCWKFGLPNRAYGKIINWKGIDYKIAAIRPRARKYPVLLENLQTGERKVCLMASSVNDLI